MTSLVYLTSIEIGDRRTKTETRNVTETKIETGAERIGTETRMDIGETETARDPGENFGARHFSWNHVY